MSYYRLIEHRHAAARVERVDAVQVVVGCVLYALLVIGACWMVP